MNKPAAVPQPPTARTDCSAAAAVAAPWAAHRAVTRGRATRKTDPATAARQPKKETRWKRPTAGSEAAAAGAGAAVGDAAAAACGAGSSWEAS